MSTRRAIRTPASATRDKRSGKGSYAKRGDRAAEIMEVALDLFAAKDYTAVTVNEIARVLGVRHSLIYYYFKNKDDLFRKTVESQIRETLENFQSMVAEHGDPVDRIEHWFDNNIALSGPLRKLVKIMFDYSGPQTRQRSLGKSIKRFYDAERDIIGSSIEQGMALGIFRPVDAEQVAAFVSTHIDGVFFSSLLRRDVDIPRDMEELKRVLWLILDYDDAQRRKAGGRDSG